MINRVCVLVWLITMPIPREAESSLSLSLSLWTTYFISLPVFGHPHTHAYSLTHSYIHTHTHMHTHTYAHTHTRRQTHPLFSSLSLSHTHTHTLLPSMYPLLVSCFQSVGKTFIWVRIFGPAVMDRQRVVCNQLPLCVCPCLSMLVHDTKFSSFPS